MIYLLANYHPDRQQSMLRFADLLERELKACDMPVEVLRPQSRANVLGTARGFGKYLGYIDKLVLFPGQLRKRLRSLKPGSLVHICDHSNAFYTQCLRGVPHLVTCHDLLAVRAARGEFGGQRTRWSGRKLQAMILNGLNAAQRVVCASGATREDVLRLTSLAPEQVEVVHMGLNYPYSPMSAAECGAILARLNVERPFILHVGGDHWYKNRRGVLEIYSHFHRGNVGRANAKPPTLLLAGPNLSAADTSFVAQSGLHEFVRVIPSATNEELRALYSAAEMLLFPSLAEGFGWPIIEAQACGCRVVTTNRPPMTEIGGSGALYIDPINPSAAAAEVLALLGETPAARGARVGAGVDNAARFSTAAMIEKYRRIYREITGSKTASTSSSLALK